MSSVNFGVQKQITDTLPIILYVHLCTHNLNLVISDAAKNSQNTISFFYYNTGRF